MEADVILEQANVTMDEFYDMPTLVSGSAIPTVSFEDVLACSYIQPSVNGPNINKTSEVYTTFTVHRLISINDIEETAKAFATIEIQWKVNSCAAHTMVAENVERVIVTAPDKIWKPKMKLANTTIDKYMRSSRFRNHLEILYVPTYPYRTLYFYLTISGVVEMKCRMNLKYFPFDDQYCDLFVFMEEPEEFVSFEAVRSKGTSKTPNTMWSLTSEISGSGHIRDQMFGISYAYYKIKLNRDPYYYTYSLLAPCSILVFTMLASFAMPAGLTYRPSITSSLILGFAMAQASVVSQIPHTTEKIIFAQYLFSLTVLTGCVSILQLFSTHDVMEKKNAVYLRYSISLLRAFDIIIFISTVIALAGLSIDVAVQLFGSK